MAFASNKDAASAGTRARGGASTGGSSGSRLHGGQANRGFGYHTDRTGMTLPLSVRSGKKAGRRTLSKLGNPSAAIHSGGGTPGGGTSGGRFGGGTPGSGEGTYAPP